MRMSLFTDLTNSMKKRLLITLPLLLASAVHAQGLNGDRQTQQEEAYNTYFRCINLYAGRYVKSEALVADIADAAMSACQDRYQDLVNATSALLVDLSQKHKNESGLLGQIIASLHVPAWR